MAGQTVLAVAAHPDDEVLGCGGSVARWAAEGAAVHFLILGEGVTSRYPTRRQGQESGRAELARLAEQAARAAHVLGAASVQLAGLPDQRLDSLDLLDVVRRVEEVKRVLDPDRVLTHHPGDLNADHRVTSQAVATAFRPLPGERCRELWFFEVPSSTEWQPAGGGTPFVPNAWVALDAAHLARKLAAMAAYEGESRAWPHPRSPEALEALARWRGSQVGRERAEAFEVGRRIE